jgi:hypothetical protein
VRPHLAVHRRGQQQRAALARACQAQQRQDLAGPPLRQLRDEVGAGRRHQHGIGLAREVDVRHGVPRAQVPLRGDDRPAGERLHRGRRDELRRGLRHHHLHGGALALQLTRQLGGLVAGHAAGQAQHEMTAGEIAAWGFGLG